MGQSYQAQLNESPAQESERSETFNDHRMAVQLDKIPIPANIHKSINDGQDMYG